VSVVRVVMVGFLSPNWVPESSPLGAASRRGLPVDRPYSSPIRTSNLSGASD
jgi:hypothetical protein